LPDDAKPYHHGDLRQALLREAERILEQDGIQALSLRAMARAAGVSHTAPRNHFSDLTGLLSELAADGHRRHAAALAQAVEAAGADPEARLKAMGLAYVRFAAEHPGLFTLMFRSEQLDSTRPALRDAIVASRAALRQAIAVRTEGPSEAPPLVQAARAAAVWSMVHGYTVLMLEGRLKGLLATVPGTDATALAEAMMDSVAFVGVD
jgi:AcrR family transcriptional regulator